MQRPPVSWLAADWPAPPGVVAGTTLRPGGVSKGAWGSLNLGAHVGDDRDNVAENRRRFSSLCALPAEPRWLAQEHGTRVLRLPASDAAAPADAAVTRDPDTVCAVLTADCLPAVFATGDGQAIGVAHAGWRGLAAGVLEAAVAALHAAPGTVMAWLGPAISATAFEVGDEVRAAFVDESPGSASCFLANERGRWQADLYGLARQRLAAVGIERVYGGGRCTFSEQAAFFSYRRNSRCGRMATFVYRRSAPPPAS